jgi:hypothetical protein
MTTYLVILASNGVDVALVPTKTPPQTFGEKVTFIDEALERNVYFEPRGEVYIDGIVELKDDLDGHLMGRVFAG